MFRVLFVLCCVLVALPAFGADTVKVVTTIPDLADWVRQVGGSHVEVKSLLQGFENPHTYEPKVSDVKALAGARVLVKVGLGLEEWLDGLVENARNGELVIVDASQGVQVIGDRGSGQGGDHEHALGNPHVWLDPASAAVMCRNIARGLEIVDPVAGDAYQKGLTAYLQRLETVTQRLRDQVRALKDRRFLSYHAAWPYFARGLGFEAVGVVTGIPGQEPSAKALAALIERVRAERIRVLVTEPQLSSKLPDLLADETGIRVVSLSPLLGTGTAADYVAQMEANAQTLIRALQE
ncbi:MAG: zinc ABC transporter substrate-binding protein, partial [Proteobacteria bacterium]|nr:zinc ABC transporter substrate-binding protein [Pseudomonadota bacterium]